MHLINTNTASINQYLEAIGKYPMLTAEEELALAKQKDLGGPEADAAVNKLVTSHLRQVFSIVVRDFSFQQYGTTTMDCIQAGNLGLIKAVINFDWRKGTRLSTYADWWIRAYIYREIHENAHMIRIPERKAYEIHKVLRLQDELTLQNGHAPSMDELSCATHLPIKRIRQILLHATQTFSYDAVVDIENDASSYVDLFRDPNAIDPYDNLERKMLNMEIKKLINQLPAKEAFVIKLYYGLDGQPQMNLTEIAATLNVSKQRTCQIKDNAMRHFKELCPPHVASYLFDK